MCRVCKSLLLLLRMETVRADAPVSLARTVPQASKTNAAKAKLKNYLMIMHGHNVRSKTMRSTRQRIKAHRTAVERHRKSTLT